MVDELTRLASLLDSVQLTDNAPDQIVWRFAADQTYTARSAYHIQFLGSVPSEATKLLWAGWASGNCRFFLWTATLGRIPTADLLQRRGWDNNYFCPLCERSLETAYHLLVQCPWSRGAWDTLAGLASLPSMQTGSWVATTNIKEWMTYCWSKAASDKRKGVLSLMHLVSWEIWRERNRRIFQDLRMDMRTFVQRLKDEITM